MLSWEETSSQYIWIDDNCWIEKTERGTKWNSWFSREKKREKVKILFQRSKKCFASLKKVLFVHNNLNIEKQFKYIFVWKRLYFI